MNPRNSKKMQMVFLLVVVSAAIFLATSFLGKEKKEENIIALDKEIVVAENIVEKLEVEKNEIVEKVEIISPLNNAFERVNKKPFGIFVSPENSPVSPERFSGYHSAIDLEIFPEEIGILVPVKTACEGQIISKSNASGYGGLIIQSCIIEDNPVTVVYGHMKISSIEKNVGDFLNQEEFLGFLGDAYSGETDGERKHLHFGIHKGSELNILGYVKNKNVLSSWIDPCIYICQ